MATALKTNNFGNYTKAAVGVASLLVNAKKLAELIVGTPAADTISGTSPSPTGLPKPEFDRIDPVSRTVLLQEIADLYSASINQDQGHCFVYGSDRTAAQVTAGRPFLIASRAGRMG